VPQALQRSLAARKQFIPWGGAGRPFQPLKLTAVQSAVGAAPPPPPVVLPPGVDPLVLWEPPPGVGGPAVRVDDALTRFLRPHQRQGVQFMFECVAGLRGFEGHGCILADDMGLGKTLQGIALLWTLLNGGHEALGGAPLARRVVICCPTSLVSNWDAECNKWLDGRVRTLPLCESSRDDVVAALNQFLSPRCPAQLLIVSYETFRLHADRFKAAGTCDLLICDEVRPVGSCAACRPAARSGRHLASPKPEEPHAAGQRNSCCPAGLEYTWPISCAHRPSPPLPQAHRLKNDQTLTNRALDGMACRRRVLLSGTPMQNQLQEFYAMVNFCNPGVLGTPAQFRRHYEAPVLAGREPGATEAQAALGAERSAALSGIVNEFILRRTNALLSAHLPPKVVDLVCCRMTPLQYDLYCHFVQSRSVRSLFSSHKSARVLSAITSLRKLLNHPK
jgi:SNF2 family DNA or RNA helicase